MKRESCKTGCQKTGSTLNFTCNNLGVQHNGGIDPTSVRPFFGARVSLLVGPKKWQRDRGYIIFAEVRSNLNKKRGGKGGVKIEAF
jgi:hypothetical protein